MKTERLLSALIIISQKGLVKGSDLAEHFGVSLRTVYRDMRSLCNAGISVAVTKGKGGGYHIKENYNINSSFFNKKEIKKLISTMGSLKLLFGKNPEFNDIILKFEEIQNKEKNKFEMLNINMSNIKMDEGLKEYLLLINKSIEDSILLQFDYINSKAEFTNRKVEPIQLQFMAGQWYLLGFCRLRNNYRKFKLIRMGNLKLNDSFIKNPVSEEEIEKLFIDNYIKNSIMVKLKFSKETGPQLNEYFSKDKIKVLKNGKYIVNDFMPYNEGLKRFILCFGNGCEIMAPRKLREEMKDYIKKLYNIYNG